MESFRIIGIGGTNGSGKDTLGQMLAERHGWLFVNVSIDIFTPELIRRGLPVDREHMAALTTEWRRQEGMGAVVDRALSFYKNRSGAQKFGGLAIGSLRHPGEADRLHELRGLVVWVEADPLVSYQRIHGRKQGAKDRKTLDEFMTEQAREMQHVGDEA